MLRRALPFTALCGTLPLVIALLFAGGAVTACSSDDSTGPTPAQSICRKVSMSKSGGISIQATCSGSRVSTVSGITYDQFSRVIAYNFEFSCSGGGERFTGRVNSVTYNNLGEAIAWSATVNGTTCTGP